MTAQGDLDRLRRRFRDLLADPTREDRENLMWQMVHDFQRFSNVLTRDVEQAEAFLEVVKACREATGPGRSVAEERLMEQLAQMAWECWRRLDDAGVRRLPRLDEPVAIAPAVEQAFLILRALCDFAIGCFQFRRPHDSFGGRRRGKAFGILARASRIFDLPEAIELARRTLKTGRGGDAPAAAEFLEQYYKARGQTPDDETVDALFKASERASSRGLAVGALSVLVETGVISELQALGRIDDWKDRHHPWRQSDSS